MGLSKREGLLLKWSREHQAALSLALRCKNVSARGDKEAVLRLAREFCLRFGAELSAHFEEEERALAPALEAEGEHFLAGRLVSEHRELAELARGLEKEPSAQALGRAGEALAAHARFEEREVFEAALSSPGICERLGLASGGGQAGKA